jgi:hypothetical protein
MKIPMKVFMGLILVIGLALIVCSFVISGSVTDCNVKVQNALRGLLVMGVTLFSVSGTLLAFNCNSKVLEQSTLGIAFIVILFLLSSSTIGLISTIYQCDDTKTNHPTILNTMLIMSILMTVGSLAYIVYQTIQYTKKGKGKGKESGVELHDISPANTASSFGG